MWGSKPQTAEFLAILQNQWVMLSVRAMFGNQQALVHEYSLSNYDLYIANDRFEISYYKSYV